MRETKMKTQLPSVDCKHNAIEFRLLTPTTDTKRKRKTCHRPRLRQTRRAQTATTKHEARRPTECACTATSKGNVWAWWELMRESKHKLARLARRKKKWNTHKNNDNNEGNYIIRLLAAPHSRGKTKKMENDVKSGAHKLSWWCAVCVLCSVCV